MLTAATPIGRPLLQTRQPNRLTTVPARLPRPIIDIERLLEIARMAGFIHEITKRGAALLDGRLKDLPNIIGQLNVAPMGDLSCRL